MYISLNVILVSEDTAERSHLNLTIPWLDIHLASYPEVGAT